MTNTPIQGKEAKIFLEAVDAAGSTFGAGIQAVVKDMPTQSGGVEETETITTFGKGRISFDKPMTDYEISLDVVATYDGQDFDALVSAGTDMQFAYAVTDGTNHRWYAYNNAKLNIERKFSADGILEGTLKLAVPATTSTGASNFKFGTTDYTDAGTGIKWE